jgi:tetratricopeptide (TPR) repeat protein
MKTCPIPVLGGAPAQTAAWKVYLAGLAIILAGWAAYSNSLQGVFLLDDAITISENKSIQQGWAEAWSPPNDGSPVTGRPLVNFSFALNYRLNGLSPWGYHVVNLAIHLLAALTLFGLVRRTLALPSLCAHYGSSALLLALSVALLWMLHPLQTDAVTYLSQRTESLMGLFYLLTLYCLVRSVQSGWPWLWRALMVAACLLGMLCKEVMVTAPLLALLYDRTFMAGSAAQAWRQRWTLYLALFCTWLPLAWLVNQAGDRAQSAGFGLGVPWWEYGWVEFRVVVHYLQLSVWPNTLALSYGNTLPPLDYTIIYDALLIAILVAGTVIALWRKSPLGFAGAWFFVILAPSSSILPIICEPEAGRRMYLPLAGLAVLAVFGLWRYWRSWTWALTLAWVVALSILTFARNGRYQSAISLWQDNIAKLPNLEVPHSSLAMALFNAGRIEEALAENEAAIRLNPQDAEAEYNFGLHLAQIGRLDQALAHTQRAVVLNPDYIEARSLTGITLLQMGRVATAIREFQTVLHLAPGSAESQINLGYAYDFSGQPELALRYYQNAARIEPDSLNAHLGLANTDMLLGRFDDAIRESKACLRLKPNDPVNHYELGLAYAKAGRLVEAIDQYKIVLTISPDFAPARDALRSAQQRLQNQMLQLAP